jgi:hypothetical protein
MKDKAKKEKQKLETESQKSNLEQQNAKPGTEQPGSEAQNQKLETKPPLTPEQQKAQETMNAKVKEIEGTVHTLKFYPVAANEETKNNALKKLEEIYQNEEENMRQLLLYMLHETLASSAELRLMHAYEYFKVKTPNLDSGQMRMNVYKSMFNYHTSLEGLIEIIRLLGRLNKGDDAAKLLTYHFSRLSVIENEATHILRAAILEALGNSNSPYALNALMNYAEYTDNERTFNRVVSALKEWEKKLDRTKISEKEKERIRTKLKEYMSRDMSESHYG